MKEKTKKKVHDGIAGSIREIVFGAEDAFVSTLGVITGIAAGTQNAYIVTVIMKPRLGTSTTNKHSIRIKRYTEEILFLEIIVLVMKFFITVQMTIGTTPI